MKDHTAFAIVMIPFCIVQLWMYENTFGTFTAGFFRYWPTLKVVAYTAFVFQVTTIILFWVWRDVQSAGANGVPIRVLGHDQVQKSRGDVREG